MKNNYSQTWFELFLDPIAAAQTGQEIEFLSRHLPPPPAAVLDIGCGQGRHANRLAARGYRVSCTNFDERQPASAASPRMQFVFEKVQ